VQANRVAYNAKQAFAYAALNGTPQKPPDLRAAVQAANQAAGHVLDGSNVQFAPAEGGVTATVNRPGSQPEQYQLSLDAFRKYLNVGGDGQWDRVMQTTVPKTLAALSQDKGQGAPGRGATRMDQLRPLQKAPPQDNSESDAYTPPAPTTNFGKTPSTLNLSGSDEITRTPTAVEETNYGSELEARARRMFPSISQEEERNRWMATEEQRQEGAQNRVDVARAGAEGKVQAAQATGQSRENVAKTNAAGHVATQQEKNKGWQYASDTKLKAAQAQLGQRIREMEARNANNDQTRALKAIQTKMLSLQALTPEEQKYLDTLPGAGTAGAAVNAPNAGSRQPAPRPQGGSQQPPVQGAKLYKGKWYTRGPNGESVPVE
jgi:hypothetical protein